MPYMHLISILKIRLTVVYPARIRSRNHLSRMEKQQNQNGAGEVRTHTSHASRYDRTARHYTQNSRGIHHYCISQN